MSTPTPAEAGALEGSKRRTIHDMLREYIDAGIAAGRVEVWTDPHDLQDPDLDRAYERVADLRTEIGCYVVGLEDRLAAAEERAERARDLAIQEIATLRQRCERLEDLVEQQGQLLTAKHDEFLRVEARANERREEIRRLREAALECAADLEAELHARYHDENGCVHPAEQHRYERDMEPVWRVRALNTPEAPDEH